MTAATIMEKEIVLKIFKDFTSSYNPGSISREIKRSRVGAFKALNALEDDGIVKGEDFGRARFYEIDLDDEYAVKNVETLLMEEARRYRRFIEEFREVYGLVDVVVLFGSILRDEKAAKDIDILLIFDKEKNSQVSHFISKKNRMLLKPIHPLKQTKDDIIGNIRKKDKVLIEAIRTGIVLHGYEDYVDIIRRCQKKRISSDGA